MTLPDSIYPKRQPSLEYELPSSRLLHRDKEEAPALMKQPVEPLQF